MGTGIRKLSVRFSMREVSEKSSHTYGGAEIEGVFACAVGVSISIRADSNNSYMQERN